MYKWNRPCTQCLLPPGSEFDNPSFRTGYQGPRAGPATKALSIAMSSRLDQLATEHWEAKAREAGFHPLQLARLCQVSVRQLERHFLKDFQFTPKKWLTHYRLREGGRLLLEGQLSVKAIAFQLNFKQPSNFSRAFKKFYG